MKSGENGLIGPGSNDYGRKTGDGLTLPLRKKKKLTMKTLKQVEITPVIVDEIPQEWTKWKENEVYVTSDIKQLAHKCLCGCGAVIVLPVNSNPSGWQLKVDEQNRITLQGSILNHSCKAHYIITKNKANFV